MRDLSHCTVHDAKCAAAEAQCHNRGHITLVSEIRVVNTFFSSSDHFMSTVMSLVYDVIPLVSCCVCFVFCFVFRVFFPVSSCVVLCPIVTYVVFYLLCLVNCSSFWYCMMYYVMCICVHFCEVPVVYCAMSCIVPCALCIVYNTHSMSLNTITCSDISWKRKFKRKRGWVLRYRITRFIRSSSRILTCITVRAKVFALSAMPRRSCAR